MHSEAGWDAVKHYDKRSDDYDRIADFYNGAEYRAIAAELEGIVNDSVRGKDALELAAGTGIWTEKIAQVARSVTASDVSQGMLNVARRRNYAHSNVTFMQGDMYSLEVPQHDAVFAALVYVHVLKQDQSRFFDAINGYVSKGAPIVIIDTTRALSSAPFTKTDAEGNTYQNRVMSDGTVEEILKNFPTEDELRTLLQGKATNVEYRDFGPLWLLRYKTLGR